MRWKGYKHYAKSDKNYYVSKGYFKVDQYKYIAYGPDGAMLDCPAFFSFKDARLECEKHYNETNKQTEADIF